MTCRCITPCSCSPAQLGPGCVPGGPSPTAPVAFANTQPLSSLACSILGGLQLVVDSARRIAHEIGARPYRVWLVWQEQNPLTAKWSQVYSLELVPVRVSADRESIETLAAGGVPTGSITLREISPIQVDELTLRGYLQGQPWGADEPTREFFFEVQQLPRCAGDPTPERYRFVLAGVPELRTDSFEWQVRLIAQFGRRSRDGQDSTVPGELYDVGDAVLVP